MPQQVDIGHYSPYALAEGSSDYSIEIKNWKRDRLESIIVEEGKSTWQEVGDWTLKQLQEAAMTAMVLKHPLQALMEEMPKSIMNIVSTSSLGPLGPPESTFEQQF